MAEGAPEHTHLMSNLMKGTNAAMSQRAAAWRRKLSKCDAAYRRPPTAT